MRIPQPNWAFARATKEKYAEDGVSGELGYDGDTGEWYVELNEGQYKRYLRKLRRRRSEVLRDYGDTFEAVNIQGQATEPPKENQNRLALYLIDIECRTAHGFGVKYTLGDVFNRKSALMFFGSTCDVCGRKMKIVLQWEDVKPKKR